MTTLIPKFEQTGTSINRPISEKLAQLPNQGDFADFAAMETYAAMLTSPSDMAVKLGTSVRTLTSVLQESISIKDFGAKGDGTTDDTAAIQAALDYCHGLTNGSAIYIPTGTYKCTASVQIYAKTLIYGEGRHASTLVFTNTGKGLFSSFTPNTSNVADIKLRDFGITCTNVSNTDGGYVDICGTFIDLENIYISGFKYGVIFDQSELVTVLRCELVNSIASGANVWLVNGAGYTVGNLPGFTNNITVRECQLNALTTIYALIFDQGGTGHWFENNNYNGGGIGIVAYAAVNLKIDGGSFESQSSYCLTLDEGAPTASGFYTPCQEVTVTNCGMFSLSGTQPTGILVAAVRGGAISNNTFSGFSSEAISLSNGNRPTGVVISDNFFIVGSATNGAILATNSATNVQINTISQKAVTASPNAAIIGANNITPTSMYGITLNSYVYLINANGTNGEVVQATAVTSTYFTATLTSTKTAGFLINGVNAP